MEINEVKPWGRNFDEYVAMFALTKEDLRRAVLGVGDGPASFNAKATAQGSRVISLDPLYAFSADEIRARVEATAPEIAEVVRAHPERFVWTHFADAEALIAARMEAMERFLTDYPTGRAEGRYVDGGLPSLPFGDQTFALALCSHYLFLYAEQLGAEYHLTALRELLRVAAEVRVFPLRDLQNREPTFLTTIEDALRQEGFLVERLRAPYEFQRGGDQLMRIAPPWAWPLDARWQGPALVAPDFPVPLTMRLGDWRARPLTPGLNAIDYPAVMATRERLAPHSSDGWPASDFTPEANADDLQRHAAEFRHRRAFCYALLSDDDAYIGCVYLQPPKREDGAADVAVSYWLTGTRADVEAREEAFADVLRAHLTQAWPFRKPLIYRRTAPRPQA